MIAQHYSSSLSSPFFLHLIPWLGYVCYASAFISSSVGTPSPKQSVDTFSFLNLANQLKSIDLNKNYLESSLRTRSRRSLRTRHQHDHHWNSNEQECHLAYEERISHHCRYPGTTEPCYEEQQEKMEKINFEKGHDSVKAMSKNCCKKTCSLEELEKLCCRTPDCLKKCYGNRLAEWVDRDRAESSLYRYFDVLIKPHPSRKQKATETI